jgi:hypothetical protein
MPYITKETVKQKREQLKKAFPDFKFSIIRHHGSTLKVHILEAPVNLAESTGEEQVNHYYIKSHYQGEKREILRKIADIMLAGEESAHYDADYGYIPNFYVSLSIGDWDKPFKYIIKGSDQKPLVGIKLKSLKTA